MKANKEYSKAVEFVKQHGWEYAKHILTDDAPLVMNLNYTYLKRLVESHQIVNTTFKGLEDAKWWHECCWDCDSVAYIPTDRLKQAIADVESCL